MSMFRRDPVRDGLLVLTVLVALTAGWFGYSWVSAATDDDLSYGRERDAVLGAASRGLVVLHTMDYRRAAADFGEWQSVSAGRLRSDLAGDREGQLKRAKSGEVISSARPVRVAVTELDGYAGTARVIAVLDVALTAKGHKATDTRRRMNAGLVRTPAGWRVSSVEAAS